MAVLLNGKTWTVSRYTKALSGGVWTESLDSSFTVRGSLQPMREAELANAPEGFRNASGEKYKLYTDGSITLISGGVEDDSDLEGADRIDYNGRTLFVRGVLDFSGGLLSQKKWMLLAPESEVGNG